MPNTNLNSAKLNPESISLDELFDLSDGVLASPERLLDLLGNLSSLVGEYSSLGGEQRISVGALELLSGLIHFANGLNSKLDALAALERVSHEK
ncbi:hypothetical protein QF117_18085 [Vibrio sp. YMD68]|uniref:hypothetical protein n=1 Tax=Vibrio TaxID=662 RepID=UPI00249B7A45|nr:MULTISPECIES: hypothetical protein [Vibrio]MEC7306041.1 hypothetical protein [Vibrio crassostreae]WGV99810.1 hypothetical protein QF117_18085 [Vibrio sp. YMD68]